MRRVLAIAVALMTLGGCVTQKMESFFRPGSGGLYSYKGQRHSLWTSILAAQ